MSRHSRHLDAPNTQKAIATPDRDLGELLKKVELFRRLPESWRGLVEELLNEERFNEEEIIFRAGDPATCVYIVEFGQVALYTDTAGEPVQLRAQITRGSVFGELGVLEGSRRCLSARATETTGLLRLDGTELLRLAKAHDEFARELCQVAIGYASSNEVARAELARRKEARIKIGRKVDIRIRNQQPISAVLENLSLGGACLKGVPEDWRLDEETPMALATEPTTALVIVHATIQWRKDDQVGLCFTRTFENHEIKIAGVVHRLTSANVES
ncbi:MAG: cyclic nucleotide-binding domain-containing protein [Acidobacteriota bacterium]|nr:cyclic nucleotide-binding domain-containing protein [Acidobacteriota bacterium]